MIKEFKTTGDKELRVVKHTGWLIPVYAYEGTYKGLPHWMVMPAIALDMDAFMVLQTAIGKHAVARIDRYWIIPGHLFHVERANGVNPTYYYYDPRSTKPPQITEASAPVQEEALPDEHHGDDFIKHVWQKTAVAELPDLRLIWHTICQEMPRWMMDKKKPVDLGWVRLVALPYRANWKCVLLGRFPWIWSLLRLPKATREAKLSLTDFPLEMSNTAYLAMSKTGVSARTIRWTIEADMAECWHKYVDEYEKAALANMTESKYLTRCANLLSKLKPLALAVFSNWVRQTILPSGAVAKGSTGRGKRLVDNVGANRVRPVSSEHVPVFVTTADHTDKIQDGFGGEIVDTEAEDLPEVPVVDFGTEDVRDAGRNGDHGGADTATRLLVPPPDSSNAPEERLLGAVDGNDNGVG